MSLNTDYLRYLYNFFITTSNASEFQVVVPLGSHVCFSCEVRNLDGALGTWSTKGGAVTLNPISGVAATHQVGRSLVWYEANGATIGTTEVNVVPISEVSIEKLLCEV